MNQQTLQQTIHNTIPMSQHMGFTITSLTDQHIEASAPLSANVNIHGTAFAGSIYTVATLTGWALVYYTLQIAGSDSNLVLGEGHIRYKAPIKGDLDCQATISETERTDFLQTLLNTGRSRLLLKVNINNAAFWEGKLTAIRR